MSDQIGRNGVKLLADTLTDDQRGDELIDNLEYLMNYFNVDNQVDTPGHILAEYLVWQLSGLMDLVIDRDQWLGRRSAGEQIMDTGGDNSTVFSITRTQLWQKIRNLAADRGDSENLGVRSDVLADKFMAYLDASERSQITGRLFPDDQADDGAVESKKEDDDTTDDEDADGIGSYRTTFTIYDLVTGEEISPFDDKAHPIQQLLERWKNEIENANRFDTGQEYDTEGNPVCDRRFVPETGDVVRIQLEDGSEIAGQLVYHADIPDTDYLVLDTQQDTVRPFQVQNFNWLQILCKHRDLFQENPLNIKEKLYE